MTKLNLVKLKPDDQYRQRPGLLYSNSPNVQLSEMPILANAGSFKQSMPVSDNQPNCTRDFYSTPQS